MVFDRRRVFDMRLRTFCQGLDNKDEAFEYLKSMNLRPKDVSIVNGHIEGIFNVPLNISTPAIRSIEGHKALEEIIGHTIPHRIVNDLAITGTDAEVARLTDWFYHGPGATESVAYGLQAAFGYFLTLKPPTSTSAPKLTDTFLAKSADGNYMLSIRRIMNMIL